MNNMMNRMSTSLSILNGFTSRAFTTSNIRSLRFRSQRPQPELKQIGRFLDKSEKPYERGQCFVHKLFAYRGIVIRSANCRVCTKRSADLQTVQQTLPFYQVLIHKDDWPEMNFPRNMTFYFKSNGNKESVDGVDVVSHDEIIPFESISGGEIDEESSDRPIKHDLFESIFKKISDADGKDHAVRTSSDDAARWFFPYVVHKQTTEQVEVQVSTYNLGPTSIKGHCFYNWRTVIRVTNTANRTIGLKNISLNVTSMRSTGPKYQHEAVQHSPCLLSPKKPVIQFNSSLFQLSHEKGHLFWGALQVEDDEGHESKIQIPPIPLEDNVSNVSEQTEKIF